MKLRTASLFFAVTCFAVTGFAGTSTPFRAHSNHNVASPTVRTHGSDPLLYTTLGPSGEFDTSNGYLVEGSNFSNQVIANVFSPNQTATFTNAMLALGNFEGGNSPVNVYLETDAGGMPGSIIDTLTQQGTITPFPPGSLINFTTTTSPLLVAGTSYWIVAQETDPNTGQEWNFAFGDSQNNVAFNQIGSATGPWTTFFGTQDGFDIFGTTGGGVPEPSSLILLGTGLLGAAGALRRKLKF